ncbi:hypothetical protein VTN96DRAFT_2488 [Rasamsonia emersonii]
MSWQSRSLHEGTGLRQPRTETAGGFRRWTCVPCIISSRLDVCSASHRGQMGIAASQGAHGWPSAARDAILAAQAGGWMGWLPTTPYRLQNSSGIPTVDAARSRGQQRGRGATFFPTVQTDDLPPETAVL